MCDAFIIASEDVLRLLPVSTLVSTAKSPSGNSGINSPPSVESINNETANSATTKPITILGMAKILIKYFWWSGS